MSNSKPVKTLFLFCEGPHDVEFVSKVMKHCLGFSEVYWKFSEYPAPLNQIFRQSVETHANQDLSRSNAHDFFLPDKIFLENDELVVFIFNTGGKTKSARVAEFLSSLDLLKNAEQLIFDPKNKKESEYYVDVDRYLFLYDADSWGLKKTAEECLSWFGTIDGEVWLEDNWQYDEIYPYGTTCNNKALYVLGETPDAGTLEDWLYLLFAQKSPELLGKAGAAIDDIFEWVPKNQSLEHKVAMTAKRKKSILTLAGQHKKPGSSMNVILGQGGMFRKSDFKTNEYVVPFVSFIQNFIARDL